MGRAEPPRIAVALPHPEELRLKTLEEAASILRDAHAPEGK
jgi:hypothetical protein